MNTKVEMNSKEFKEGYSANAKSRNPYRSGTYQYELWRDGRIEATLQGK